MHTPTIAQAPTFPSGLADLNFTAVDFETANGRRGSVCGAGITQVRAGRITRIEQTLVRPPWGLDHFSPRNIAVHGITFKQVQNAPTWPEVWQTLTEVAGDDVIVAHNAAFDASVITAANAACGIEADPVRSLCTVKLARVLLPELPDHKLPTVASHLGLADFTHHDAGDDAATCAQIAVALAARSGTATAAGLLSLIPAPATRRRG